MSNVTRFNRYYDKHPEIPELDDADDIQTVPGLNDDIADVVAGLKNREGLRRYEQLFDHEDFNLEDVWSDDDISKLDPLEARRLEQDLRHNIHQVIADARLDWARKQVQQQKSDDDNKPGPEEATE